MKRRLRVPLLIVAAMMKVTGNKEKEAMLDALIAPAANHMLVSRDYGFVSEHRLAPPCPVSNSTLLATVQIDVISPVSHEVIDHLQKKKKTLTLMPLGQGLSSDTGKQHKITTAERPS
jgi:hypothetical protein